ncbi:MAG: hypoxanthine phosphoribosyltransferase [Oscillospiraceae bacterium]
MLNDIKQTLITKEEIAQVTKKLGQDITRDYQGKDLLLVTVLKGAVVFLADLMREIDTHCEIDFMVVSSYGSGVKTSGNVKIVKDINIPLENKDVLIVEDILDSGLTLNYIIGMLKQRNPKSIEIVTLLDKPSRRACEVRAKYIGRQVPDEFVVGYGLDFDEKYRNLPFIGILKPEVYTK